MQQLAQDMAPVQPILALLQRVIEPGGPVHDEARRGVPRALRTQVWMSQRSPGKTRNLSKLRFHKPSSQV